jgi:hypothetical protein
MVAFLVYLVMKGRHPSVVVVPMLVWVVLLSGLLERVVVVGNRNPRYCRACRYDLGGTFDAGIRTCPECGRDAGPPG